MSTKISSMTRGHRWQDWSKVRRFLSAEDIAAMEQAGTIRVDGDTAVLLETWHFQDSERRIFDTLVSMLTERGWTVKKPAPVPNLSETAAEARLTLPKEFGGAVVYAEFFMNRRYDPQLALHTALAFHKVSGQPFILIPRSLDHTAADAQMRHTWELFHAGELHRLEASITDLAPTLAKVVRAIEEPPATDPKEEEYRTSLVPLHTDRPASSDRLGREAFARALAKRLRRVVLENMEDAGQLRSGFDGAFMVHLHAPWGAGKTTLLNFLSAELTCHVACHEPWIAVHFNAWRHQRVEPPWWSLLDTVFHDALRSFRGQPGRMASTWLGEQYRRLSKAWAHVILAAGLLVWLVFLGAYAGWFNTLHAAVQAPEGLKQIGELVKTVSAGVALALTLWGSAVAFGRTLFRGSAQAAESFVRSSEDPMRQVARHFRRLVDSLGRQVVVFVDDIDRCDADFVIRLLEGIQTLFQHPKVVFVVAGDRRWLNVCFEKTYGHFVDDVAEPGRGLGTLFLAKAFQLSVGLPQLSEHQQREYWDYLLRSPLGSAAEIQAQARREAKKLLGDASNERQVIDLLDSAGEDKVLEQAIREEAVQRLADRDLEASTQHFLQKFAPLLEPNPRSMKRFINTYAVCRDIAILAHIDFEDDPHGRDRLALLTIVSLRWPQLEEYLVVHPELADSLAEHAEWPQVEGNLRLLVASPEVRRVFDGSVVGTKLDTDAVLILRQLSTSINSGRVPGSAVSDARPARLHT